MFLRNRGFLLVATAILFIDAGVKELYAQKRVERPPMTQPQCRDVSVSVNAGSLQVINQWPLGECGDLAPEIVAAAISKSRNLRAESVDISYGIIGYASDLRDARIYNAALEIAKSSQASILARLTSMNVLGIYYDKDFVTDQTIQEMIKGPVKCTIFGTGGITHRQAKEIRPLPANANSVLAASVDAIMRDGSSPPQVRNFAKCLRATLYRTEPSNLPANSLNIEYNCDRITVKNTLDEYIMGKYVTLIFPGTAETFQLSIAPREFWKRNSVPNVAVAQILENGKVIGEARNRRDGCEAHSGT